MNTPVRPLTTTEVAARLGIARQTVVQRVRNGKLTTIGQLPGRNGAFLFDAEQIDAIAEGDDQAPRNDRNPQPAAKR